MSSLQLTFAEIERLRAHRWRTDSSRQVRDESDALRFIKELGFVLLMPIKGEDLPSIHRAAGGDWGLWWDWKQTLPERKACYYAKLLRRRGTFLSWPWFPAFYRAYADPRPYPRLYRDGLLDRTEKQILDLLRDRGQLMTKEIRLAFGPQSKENTRRVKSLLVELQSRFLITAAGGEITGWSHHRWDLVERFVPARALAAAVAMSQQDARSRIIYQFVKNMVATTPADIAWTFGWGRREVISLIEPLIEAHKIHQCVIPELKTEAVMDARTANR